jgi:hypothetical protein
MRTLAVRCIGMVLNPPRFHTILMRRWRRIEKMHAVLLGTPIAKLKQSNSAL